MEFKTFNYKKKKDGDKKSYFVLVMNQDENYTEGLDMNKLEEDEVKEAITHCFGRDVILKEIQGQTEGTDQDIETFLENNEDYKNKIDALDEKLHPYVKKAYKKFLNDRIELLNPDDIVPESNAE